MVKFTSRGGHPLCEGHEVFKYLVLCTYYCRIHLAVISTARSTHVALSKRCNTILPFFSCLINHDFEVLHLISRAWF